MFQITTQFDIINFQCENIDFLYFLFIFSLKIRLDTYLTLNQAAIIIVREKKTFSGLLKMHTKGIEFVRMFYLKFVTNVSPSILRPRI